MINNSPDEEARKIAIGRLGSGRHYDAIHLLLNHVKREISYDEKTMVAYALDMLDKKSEALELFNCNCYAVDYINHTCVTYYFYLSEDRVAAYFM